METEARLLHDGSGYAVARPPVLALKAGELRTRRLPIALVPFPNEMLRAEMLATARRVAVPGRRFLNG